jgi:hypothetical protein
VVQIPITPVPLVENALAIAQETPAWSGQLEELKSFFLFSKSMRRSSDRTSIPNTRSGHSKRDNVRRKDQTSWRETTTLAIKLRTKKSKWQLSSPILCRMDTSILVLVRISIIMPIGYDTSFQELRTEDI